MSLLAPAGLALAIVLLLALHLRMRGLPLALLAVARRERAQDGGALLDAMKEAVAARSGQAVIAVQTYHEHLAQSLRAQIAEAETRARVAERRAADTVSALEAAATLVRELRGALDGSAALARELRAAPRAAPTLPPSRPAPPSSAPRAIQASPRPAAADPDDAERQTVEMPASSRRPPPPPPESGARPPRGDAGAAPECSGLDFEEDDETKVADRVTTFAAFREVRRSPTVLPPAPGQAVGASQSRGSGGAR